MTRTSRDESVRPTRTSVASNRAPLTYKGLDRENFEPRFVLDKDDRIAMFLEAGYEFVKPNGSGVGEKTVESSSGLDSRVSKSTRGTKLYLMQLPMKFYKEDQLAKIKLVEEMEASMKPRRNEGAEADYGKVSITTGKGTHIVGDDS
jgi:hypothetical protein